MHRFEKRMPLAAFDVQELDPIHGRRERSFARMDKMVIFSIPNRVHIESLAVRRLHRHLADLEFILYHDQTGRSMSLIGRNTRSGVIECQWPPLTLGRDEAVDCFDGFAFEGFASQYGYGVQRPNETSASPTTSGSVEGRLYDYINRAAFTAAPAGTFGNTPRTLGSLRGPGEKNWDVSIFKNFTFKERFKAQFRAEALNAFNSPYFYSPQGNISNGSFGQINGQANFARQLQLAIRFTF
jgi:hypothetical protein